MIGKRLHQWLCVLGIAIFGFLAVFSCFSTKRMYTGSESLYWEWDNVLWKLFFLAALAALCLLIHRKKAFLTSGRMHLLAALVSCLAVAFCVLLAKGARSLPDADQWYVYVAAEGLFERDYTDIQNYGYYTVYPHQLGMAWLYMVIARLAGAMSPEVLRCAQAFCVGAGIYFAYLTCRELFRNVAAECVCLLLSLLFLPLLLYSQFLYGETIGACMGLACICFFLRANRLDGRLPGRIVFWAGAVVAFSLVYLVRPALVVIWIAMAMIQLALCIRERRLLPMAIMVAMLLAGVGGQRLVVGYVGHVAGIDVDNGLPLVPLNIAMGIQDDDPNQTGAGSYNGYNYNLFAETGGDGPESTRRALQSIKRTLYQWSRNPGKMCAYLSEKALNQWIEPGYGAFTMTCKMEEPEEWVEDLYYDRAHDMAYGLLDCIQTACYLALVLWLLLLLQESRRGEDVDARGDLIVLILIGEFFFSMLWEAKSRYVYPYMVILLPWAAGSLAVWYGRLESGLRKRNESRERNGGHGHGR